MTRHIEVLILGAGLSGLSASYHIGHDRCHILECHGYTDGHVATRKDGGYTWDRGPHVSFTEQPYVKDLFSKSVGGEFDEFEAKVGNYFHGAWIDHPAQSNLYQVPEPLRSQCLDDFLTARRAIDDEREFNPENYTDWLTRAFGPVFTDTFPRKYTRKYWTTDADNLTTAWVGKRIYLPSLEDVVAGSTGPLDQSTHYIRKVRYPKRGGYGAFANALRKDANISLNKCVVSVDLVRRTVTCSDQSTYSFDTLISTIPLSNFIGICAQVDQTVREAASKLISSELLLVDVELPHPVSRPEHWLYVYDEDKYATRIHFPDKLTSGNVPDGRGSIQVEVYFSKYRPLKTSKEEVGAKVVGELADMGLIDETHGCVGDLNWHVRWEPNANVIFDKHRERALDTVLRWLCQFGLERMQDDLAPTTDWPNSEVVPTGALILAGRFGQHKYYWSDDCVMRGRQISKSIKL